MTAATLPPTARFGRQRARKVRAFLTPEGVDLELEIASSGLRFGALLIDLTLMAIILIVISLILFFGGLGIGGADVMVIVWLLGFFLLRNFWFILFELGPRAATPGKRLVGVRVVARDGGRLTVAAVVARNLVREAEMFLPLAFLAGGASDDLVGAGQVVLGLLWTGGMSLFLLANQDRMRLGDIIGGTWVVMAKRAGIAADLSAPSAADDALTFTADELAVYGVYELQELERVLRGKDPAQQRSVSDTIRTKLGRGVAEDDDVFLAAYYRQARARMERDLLFGKRRADKYEAVP